MGKKVSRKFSLTTNSFNILTTLTFESLTFGVEVALKGVALKAGKSEGTSVQQSSEADGLLVGDVPSMISPGVYRRRVRLGRGQAPDFLMCSLFGADGRFPLLDPKMFPCERHQTGNHCLTSNTIICTYYGQINGLR